MYSCSRKFSFPNTVLNTTNMVSKCSVYMGVNRKKGRNLQKVQPGSSYISKALPEATRKRLLLLCAMQLGRVIWRFKLIQRDQKECTLRSSIMD